MKRRQEKPNAKGREERADTKGLHDPLSGSGMSGNGVPGLRLDKWLWQARFFKSRTLASKLCNAGKVRIDGAEILKSHSTVRPGNVLTFPQGRHIRVVRIIDLGTRRGPAEEAQGLYEDLKPPAKENRIDAPGKGAAVRRSPGSGRPTKRERRQLDRLRRGEN
jgi:ribosome-associated heat shock protein Hsp15